MAEYKTMHFLNTPEGQRQKVEALAIAHAEGWRVISETIEQGKFRGGEACCLFMICAPCAFLAGNYDSTIHVTLEREQTMKCPYCAEAVNPEAVVCRHCGRDIPEDAIIHYASTSSQKTDVNSFYCPRCQKTDAYYDAYYKLFCPNCRHYLE